MYISNVTIYSTILGDDITKYYRNDTQYYVSLYDIKGNTIKDTYVLMNINGVIYNRSTNSSDIIRLSINLNLGEYTITVYNPLNNQSFSNHITALSRINGSDIRKYFRNSTQYYAKLVDSTGKALANRDVTMNINRVFYTRKTNENGIVMLSINLNPRTYIITVYDPLTNQTYSNTIKILAVLTGNDLTKNFGESGAYEIRLLDNTGKTYANEDITINIHGVFYTRTTASDGIARLNINLNPGSYIATAYWGDYAVTSNTITIIGQ